MVFSVPKFTIIIVILLILLSRTSQQNLLCNGDFQSYSLSAPFLSDGYYIRNAYIPPDPCWYAYNTYQIQIQQPMYAPYSQMAQLNGLTQPSILCQNLSIPIYQLYNFTFQFAINNQTLTTNVSVYINSNLIQSIYHDFSIFPNLITVTYIFQPFSNINQFCISSYQTLKVPNYPTTYATLVDNFQLRIIPKITIPIKFQITLYQQISTIIFNTTNPIQPSSLIPYVLGNTVLLNQYGSIITCVFSDDINGYMLTSLIMTQPVNVSMLSCDTAGYVRIGDQLYIFACKINVIKQKQIFVPMTENDVRTIQDIQKFGHTISENIFNFYNFVRLVGCSYFFVNFITFYCLLVLYNFLNLSMQPQFSYKIMKQLASFYLKSDDNIFTIIKSFLGKLRIQPSYNFNSFVNNNEYYQRIATLKNGFSWFKQFGITYNFLENNFSDLCILVLILVKLILIYYISKYFLAKKQKSSLTKKQNYYQIFIVQGLCSAPVIIISALSLFLSSGTYKFTQKINYTLHIILFSLTICLPLLYTLLIYRKYRSQLSKLKNKDKNHIIIKKRLKLKFYWGQCCTCLQYGLYILIPCLAAINNKITFLIVTSFYLIIFYISYIKGYISMSTYKKIYNSLIIFIFTIHHICFVFIFVIQALKSKNQHINQQNIYDIVYYCKVASIIVILTVICGGFIEIIDCLIEFIKNVIKPTYLKIKNMLTKCWLNRQNDIVKSKSSMPKQQFIRIDPTSVNQNKIPISIDQKISIDHKQNKYQKQCKQEDQIQYIPAVQTKQQQAKRQTVKSQYQFQNKNDIKNQKQDPIINYFIKTHKNIGEINQQQIWT